MELWRTIKFMLRYLRFFLICFIIALSGCASIYPTSGSEQSTQPTISLPLLKGWYLDKEVFYVTTDVSDPDMAEMFSANYVPRLYDALPDYPKPPGVRTVLERVYTFADGSQPNNVFASIPEPLGPASQDEQYSPVWIVFMVEWIDKTAAKELRSEEAIQRAKRKGLVKVTRTDVVVNCPIVGYDGKFLGTVNSAAN